MKKSGYHEDLLDNPDNSRIERSEYLTRLERRGCMPKSSQ